MKTVVLMVLAMALQVGFMLAAYGSHVFGLPLKAYLGPVIWILLPLVAGFLAYSGLLSKTRWNRKAAEAWRGAGCAERSSVVAGLVPRHVCLAQHLW